MYFGTTHVSGLLQAGPVSAQPQKSCVLDEERGPVRFGLFAHTLRSVVVALGLLAGACAEPEPSRAEQCERLRAHLVELRLEGVAANGREAIAAAHRAALTSALGDDFISTCTQKLERAQVECALAARDVAAAMTCAE